MVEEVERPTRDRVDADPDELDTVELASPVARRRRPTGEPPPLPADVRWRGQRWLLVALAAIAASSVSLLYLEGARVTAVDQTIAEGLVHLRTGATVALARAASWLSDEWVLRVLRWGTILVLASVRRFRHLLVFVAALLLVEYVAALMNFAITRPRPVVEILTHWEGFSHPSRPFAGLTVTLVGMVRVLVPQGPRRDQLTWAVGAVLAGVGLGRMLLGVDHLTDVLVAGAIGGGVAFSAFRLLAPSSIVPVVYRRGQSAHLELDPERRAALRTALRDQLGLQLRDVQLHGTEGSAGSTPMRLEVSGPDGRETLFAKLYTRHHLRADRSYKLVRTLLYGSLEDETPFTTVRRLVQYEDHMSRVMRDAGVGTPAPRGIVEITPEREYLLAFDFVAGEELADVDVDEALIDAALHTVQLMWAGGLAHRDIKPSNVMVADGTVQLIDTAFAEIRPSPWRQAVDLAAMMLVLALRSDAETVYARATEQFSEEEIAEAFAATSGFAMPGQLRQMLDADGRDLVARFRELAPDRAPIRVHRWGARRVALAAATIVALGAFGWLAWASFSTAGLL